MKDNDNYQSSTSRTRRFSLLIGAMCLAATGLTGTLGASFIDEQAAPLTMDSTTIAETVGEPTVAEHLESRSAVGVGHGESHLGLARSVENLLTEDGTTVSLVEFESQTCLLVSSTKQGLISTCASQSEIDENGLHLIITPPSGDSALLTAILPSAAVGISAGVEKTLLSGTTDHFAGFVGKTTVEDVSYKLVDGETIPMTDR